MATEGFFLSSQFNKIEEGWVFKLSEHRLKWNRRYLYFDFDKRLLHFYTDESRRMHKSSYELTKDSTVELLTVQEKGSAKMMIALGASKEGKKITVHIQTATIAEREKWLEIFSEALHGVLVKQPKLCSKAFHNTTPLKITFHVSKQLIVEANDGSTLDPRNTENPPVISFITIAGSQTYYTLILLNPDVPQLREFVHWVVVNIPGNDVTAGQTVCPYLPACPLFAAGKQRYFFLLYEQDKFYSRQDIVEAQQYFSPRYELKASDWVLKKGVGVPIGCNGFQCEWTSFCDHIHEKISFLPPEKYRSPQLVGKDKSSTVSVAEITSGIAELIEHESSSCLNMCILS